MSKVCDYCQQEGEAYTFTSGETICSACLRVLPTDAWAGRKLVYTLRDEVEQLRQALQSMLDLWGRVHGGAAIGKPTVNAARKALTGVTR